VNVLSRICVFLDHRKRGNRLPKGMVGYVLAVNPCIGFLSTSLSLATVLAGCNTTDVQRFRTPRMLTSSDLEKITAGSSDARNEIIAYAVGAAPEATVSGTVSAFSGYTPIIGMPISNYAVTQGKAFARGSERAETLLLSGLSVHHLNREAELDGVAESSGNSRAEATTQFYGVSTKTADIVFGSIRAIACCDVTAGTQANVFSKLRGSYTTEVRNRPLVNRPGEPQSRLDLAVVSSTLPLLPAGQALLSQTLSPRSLPQ
jgi:hypothetical protein